jgi:hypothetical protein
MTVALVDVTQHACPSCTRLVCRDWRTCPGYLRDLIARLEPADRIDGDRLFRDDRAVLA